MSKFGTELDFFVHMVQLMTFLTLSFGMATIVFTGTTAIEARIYWLIIMHIPTVLHMILFLFRPLFLVNRVHIYHRLVMERDGRHRSAKKVVSGMEIQAITFYALSVLILVSLQTLTTCVSMAVRAKWYFGDAADTSTLANQLASLIWTCVDTIIAGLGAVSIPMIGWQYSQVDVMYKRIQNSSSRKEKNSQDESRDDNTPEPEVEPDVAFGSNKRRTYKTLRS
jgi:hypothetical protein